MTAPPRGKPQPDGPRRYPLARLCCAVTYLRQCESHDYRQAGLRVIQTQISVQYAREVLAEYERARAPAPAEPKGAGSSRRRGP